MKSNWDKLKPRTSYHFDSFKNDPAYDSMRYVGRFEGNWQDELQQTIESSRQTTWRNRDPKGGVSPDITQEEYDLERSGAGADLVVSNLEYELLPVVEAATTAIQKITPRYGSLAKKDIMP